MNCVTASRISVKRPKWVLANLVETTQAAADNVLKGYGRGEKPKKNKDKELVTELARNEHSYTSLGPQSKVPRDVFGATILPSNLSFDNMKKLSTNQIKLEDIPVIDEGDVDADIKTQELPKSQKSVKEKEMEEGELGPLFLPVTKKNAKKCLEFSKADPFEEVPGPRFFENVASTISSTVRHTTVHFVLRLLRSGSIGPFRKYGPIVRLPEIMGGKILLVNRAEDISAICEQDKRLPTSSSLEVLECSRLRRHGKLKRECLSYLDWDEDRKAIDEALLKDEEKYYDGLEENGNHLVQRIRCLKNSENEVPAQFITDINQWSLECLFRILFDKSFGFLDSDNMKMPSKNAQLLAAVHEATRSINLCENGFQLWRQMKTSAATSLDASCHTIENILSQYVYESQMDLSSRGEDSKSEPFTLIEGMLLLDGLTKLDVVTNLLDILLIGMNATTSALAFLLYHLARNPRTQNELFREIKKVLPEKYTRLEYDQLVSLRYLQACLKESLRLKMPVPILTKYLSKDIILSNFQIPRGTFVLMAAQLEALRDENFEAAQEFRPRRWLDSDHSHPFTHLPLSAYSQNSFETRQAEISVMTCVAQIIRNFIIEFNYGTINSTNSTISYPVTPLKFVFLERED